MNDKLIINPGNKILISRTDKLGDLILALPFVETIKKRYPNCKVDLLSSLYASPILDNNPYIDNIVRVQNDQMAESRHYRKELLQKIRKGKYDVAVVLFPERKISRLLYKAEIPNRIGTAGRFHSVYFNHRLMHSRKANKKHELEYNFDFLGYFKDGETANEPNVYPTDKERRYVASVLKEEKIIKSPTVIHPGSGGSAHRWPTEKYIKLAAQLQNNGIDVVFTGSDEEAKEIDKICLKENYQIKSLAGKTDLRILAALLEKANLVVANSTGPLHLASAVGTKVVGLYPRQHVMSPVRWGPRGDGNILIQPAKPECDCIAVECRCMDSITVETVYQKIIELRKGMPELKV